MSQHLAMNLADAPLGTAVVIESIGGHGSFRRRLLELGLLPNVAVTLMSIAPLGDPIELLVRGASLSIRRADASTVRVKPLRKASMRPAAAHALPLGGDHWAGSTP
ncbi:MAG TPA: FeoA domain-containing protein [Polyangiaceae bacterium]